MTFDPDTLTWDCMVCGAERPDRSISVAYRPLAGLEDQFPATRTNVRFCNDRMSCAAEAQRPGPWVPPVRPDPRPPWYRRLLKGRDR